MKLLFAALLLLASIKSARVRRGRPTPSPEQLRAVFNPREEERG